MAKRKRNNDIKRRKDWEKEGRGRGRLKQYKPYIEIQDIASKGISPRTKGWKTKREHHFLSKLELQYFFLLEWSEDVIDIREQFPLDLEETLALAKNLHIDHPPKSNPEQPTIITTDFLITVACSIGTKDYARTTKYSNDLKSKRVLEKFELERQYWTRRNISWGIITELDIDRVLSENVKTIHTLFDIKNNYPEITPSLIKKAKVVMTPLLNADLPLWEIAKNCDDTLSLKTGMSLTIAQHLIATRHWKIDMTHPFPFEVVSPISDGGVI